MEFNIKKKQFFKIIIVGDAVVGKSAISYRFNKQKFNDMYRATIGADFISKNIEYDGSSYTLQIWDSVSQEFWMSLGL